MISFHNIHKKFDAEELQQYAGVKFKLDRCIGEGCQRDGNHNDHVWFEEILITDEVSVEKKNDRGSKTIEKIYVPIRWFNFTLAFYKVILSKKFTENQEVELAKASIQWAKENCFDPCGDPRNMASVLGFSSYSKLLKAIDKGAL